MCCKQGAETFGILSEGIGLCTLQWLPFDISWGDLGNNVG